MKSVDICIPAYNEADIIEETLSIVKSILPLGKKYEWRIVLVNNNSTDDTEKIASQISDVFLLNITKKGKGAAVVGAANESVSDIFGFMDADLSVSPESIYSFVEMLEGGADIVIGSRLLQSDIVNRSFLRTLSSRVFAQARKLIVGINIEDTQCGFKFMNSRGRDVLMNCKESGWFFDIEFLARAEKAGLIIKEIPVKWEENKYVGRISKLNLIRDSLDSIRIMFRIRKDLN